MSSRAALVEAAMLARVVAANFSYRPTVESYGGQLSKDSLVQAVQRFPAVFGSYVGRARPQRKGAARWVAPATFALYVAATGPKSEADARKGTPRTREPGAYQMLADLSALFAGWETGIDGVDVIQPGAESLVLNTIYDASRIVIYRQEWLTRLEVDAVDPAAGAGDLNTVGGLSLVKPGDDTVDFTTLVELAP